MTTDNASKPRPGEELDTGVLTNFLKKEIPGFGTIANVAQFPGGFSNLTYLVEAGGKEYVLRRPPVGASIKGGHDMEREFRVLTALKNAKYEKAPAPICMEVSGEILGAPFYIMERLRGIVIRGKDASDPALAPDVMLRLCEKLVDNLADLHNLDIFSTGLANLGKPEGYVNRQVEGWISRYFQSQTDEIPNMTAVAEWMQRNRPIEQPPAFLHNDYKFDNVVWDENLTKIVGVLDWEMATVGDPLMDLGACLAYWCEAGDPVFVQKFNPTWARGALTRQQVVEKYASKTGRDLRDVLFYYVFGLFKNAVIGQQIYARWKKGQTADARFGGLIEMVRGLSDMAAKAVDSGNINRGVAW